MSHPHFTPGTGAAHAFEQMRQGGSGSHSHDDGDAGTHSHPEADLSAAHRIDEHEALYHNLNEEPDDLHHHSGISNPDSG